MILSDFKDEGDSNLKNLRGNILQLASSTATEKWRRLIIDFEPPQFALLGDEGSFWASQSGNRTLADLKLNPNQKDAIKKVPPLSFCSLCDSTFNFRYIFIIFDANNTSYMILIDYFR